MQAWLVDDRWGGAGNGFYYTDIERIKEWTENQKGTQRGV